jgi:hypothetical protein
MLILPITRNWMLTRRARRVYTVCAVLNLIFVGTVIGTRSAQTFADVTKLPPLTDVLFTVVWIPGIAATALVWVAMFYFWFGFDQSHWLARAFWFVALFFFAPYGPPLYCFFVYRRRTGDEGQMSSLRFPTAS